jgi:hypothetical protein
VQIYVLDDEYKPVMGQQARFYVLDEAIEAACKWTRIRNRPLKLWEYRNSVRALVGAVQPDGTLVRPPKEVVSIVTALIDKGHGDLADELLDQ